MMELEIESIRVRQETKQRAIVLRVKESDLYLPIFIGHFEVEAIRLKLMDVEVPRPMTHDLLGSVIGNLGASVQRIIVSELKNDTFFAKIVVDYNGSSIEIDSRPSDALALAVRTNAPIFAEDDVVERAGVSLDVESDESESMDAEESQTSPVAEEELERLSAYTDFIDSLDLDDLGKDA
ncbi:MAG: bifunctional nuclease family protein [SAR202 cluster bacterium]|jgi:bifunctional DNase/RNase|nr:bifunctional nuclease family protein [SAR202 cluster bacterium]MED5429057.1 bifunctional nuclease family protein [Chloroflexota bacterium]MQG74648.1 bifunctional nuclease family protein [SAR202 cluster bacterium]|tara:strand:- start:2532 stop:3071 length:540 start_codon:yes stop_codon:yes gene_type:complete